MIEVRCISVEVKGFKLERASLWGMDSFGPMIYIHINNISSATSRDTAMSPETVIGRVSRLAFL